MTDPSPSSDPMIVAIDGPAASGKSSVARLLALGLSVPFLNTGAMYRAVGLACKEGALDWDDGSACAALAGTLDLDFDDGGEILVNGKAIAVTGEIAGEWASRVATHKGVREAMVARQRVLGQRHGCVAEGRDIGTVVFPAATLKVFLVASPKVRALRRAQQEGHSERASQYEAELRARDRRDRERAIAPLRPAPGAMELNSDDLTVAEVVERILKVLGDASRGASS